MGLPLVWNVWDRHFWKEQLIFYRNTSTKKFPIEYEARWRRSNAKNSHSLIGFHSKTHRPTSSRRISRRLTGLPLVWDVWGLKFGYIPSGPVPNLPCRKTSINSIIHTISDESLDVSHYWNVESLGLCDASDNTDSQLDKFDIQDYCANHIRFVDGQYEVRSWLALE